MMTSKKEFMDVLSVRLASLSVEERNAALRYYEEYFEDCEDEQKALEALGDPVDCAEQILKENGIKTKPNVGFVYQNHNENIAGASAETKKKSSERFVIALLIGIISFPLWIAAIAIIFALAVSIIALNIAAVALGTVGLVAGVVKLFTSAWAGGTLIGAALIAIGLIGLVLIPLAVWFIKLMVKLVKKVSKALSGFVNG